MSPDDALCMAINLARNCGYAVFPCGASKRPTRPSEHGVLHGFHDASTDPDEIAWLWRNWPGELIGIATGERSGIDVLDLDVKHDAARAWYQAQRDRLPITRSFRTRSGGVHLYLQHADGVRNSQGKLAPGIDVRGDGGYAIYWFAAGFECLEHAPPASWPAWLLDALLAKPTPSPTSATYANKPYRTNSAVDGVLRLVANAAEGERNAVLHWAACRLGERAHAGQIGRGEAERLLVAAGIAAGLADKEARATVLSGLRRATA
jgi:bifunctional DNA primase/polymerase-like protein